MKIKKLISLFLAAAVLMIGAVAVSASNEFPLNYSCFITHNEQGVPSIHFKFINTGDKTITNIEYKATLFNKDYQPAYDTSNKTSSCRVRISNLKVSKSYEVDEITTELSPYPTAAHVGQITYLKVTYSDGKTWENQDNVASVAGLTCLNTIKDNKYFTYDNVLNFCDTSVKSESRIWYIWDDGIMGWKEFSQDIAPSCKVEGTQACVKIVINGDQNNYKIGVYDVTSNGIAVTYLATGESRFSRDGAIVFNANGAPAPYGMALWDFEDRFELRDWYLWSDATMSWNYISSEQGPFIVMENASSACLKIEYNKDPFNYIIYNVNIQ